MNPMDWVEKNTILLCEVGSGVHGIAQGGRDDTDEMGVCLEPIEYVVGTAHAFDQHIMRTAAIREGRHDAPSQPGDTDRTVYSLRKYCRLALKGNPSVLVLLYAPFVPPIGSEGNAVRVMDAHGATLREMAPLFASKRAGAAFMGYLQAQRMKLLGERGQMNVNRRDLVEQFGYDTKFAGHMLRLGYQGVEYLETGRITLPMPETQRARVLAIRRGEVQLQDVLTETGGLETHLRDLLSVSPLPEQPDTERVDKWLCDVYFAHWHCTRDMYRHYAPIAKEQPF